MSISLTAQDIAILRKMSRSSRSLETSTSTKTWQPSRSDLPAVQSMIERGILEGRPGFPAALQLTDTGREAADEWQDQYEARRAAEMGY